MLLAGCAVIQLGTRPGHPEGKDDIVHLDGGGQVRGIIVERIPGTSLSVRSRDGTLWVLQESQILRVEQRSVAGAAAPGMPVVQMPDTALAGKWVRITARGIGSVEGRVARIDTDRVVVRHGLITRQDIPRAAITSALISQKQSNQAAAEAATQGLTGAVFFGLFVSAFGADAAMARKVAAGMGALGAVLGAGFGSLEVEHKEWRRLEMSPAATTPPVSSRGVAVGVHVRL
jgi:hypothetical protein